MDILAWRTIADHRRSNMDPFYLDLLGLAINVYLSFQSSIFSSTTNEEKETSGENHLAFMGERNISSYGTEAREALLHARQSQLKTKELLSDILGLKLEVLQHLDVEISPDDTEVDIIKELLKKKSENIPPQMDTLKQFKELGFTDSTANALSVWVKMNPFGHLQEPPYWALRYIEDQFDHLNEYSRYPYDNKPGFWYQVPVNMVSRGGSPGEIVPVDCMNRCGPFDRRFVDKHAVRFPPQTSGDHVILYHGTSHRNAQHIMCNGILLDKGSRKQDFSNGSGFYFGFSYDAAVEWATRDRFKPSPAVIVFKLPVAIFGKYKVAFFGLGQNTNMWVEIICYNRSGGGRKSRGLRDIYKNYDFLDGPMCLNPHAVRDPSRPPLALGPRQICIISETMAEEVGHPQYIHSVIFF